MRGLIIYETRRYVGGSKFIDKVHEIVERYDDIDLVMKEDVAVAIDGQDIFITLPDGTVIDKYHNRPDWIMIRSDDWEYALAFESIGIPCYPPSQYSRFADNKSACHILMSQVFPSPKTLLKKGTFTQEEFPCPYIMKAVSGHGGASVKKVDEAEQGASYADELDEQNIAYICQEMAPKSDDLRVYIMGREIVAAVLRRATDGGYRANIGLGGEGILYELSESERDLIEKTVDMFSCELGFVCFDFLFDGTGNLIFNEMNNLPGTAALAMLGLDGDLMERYIDYMDKTAPNVAATLMSSSII